jgi:hypothetical protein
MFKHDGSSRISPAVRLWNKKVIIFGPFWREVGQIWCQHTKVAKNNGKSKKAIIFGRAKSKNLHIRTWQGLSPPAMTAITPCHAHKQADHVWWKAKAIAQYSAQTLHRLQRLGYSQK